MPYKFIIIFIGLFWFSNSCEAQELVYRIVWKGDSIGYVNSQRKDSLEFEVYKIESRVSIWVFGRKHINYDFYSVYRDSELIKGNTLNTKNKSIEGQSSIRKMTESYFIEVDGKELTHDHSSPIKSSIITLYHKEPVNCSRIFSERYGKHLSVEKKGDHHYSIEKPNGRLTDYYYQNGRCQTVEVDSFFARITFELIQ